MNCPVLNRCQTRAECDYWRPKSIKVSGVPDIQQCPEWTDQETNE